MTGIVRLLVFLVGPMWGQPPMSRCSGSLCTSTGYVSAFTHVWLGTLFTLPSWPHLIDARGVNQSIPVCPFSVSDRLSVSDRQRRVLEVDGAATDGDRVPGGIEHQLGVGGDGQRVRGQLDGAAVGVGQLDGVRRVV